MGGIQGDTWKVSPKESWWFLFPPFLFVYGLAICSEHYFFISCCSFTSILPPLPTLICVSHFYSTPILHLSPQQAPTLSTPISVCLFLSVIVSLVQRRTELKSRAKLARATTLLLPSGWDSFNAPLESSTVCVHSLLRTSFFLHKTTAKKTGEKSEKHIKGQQKPQNGEQPLLITWTQAEQAAPTGVCRWSSLLLCVWVYLYPLTWVFYLVLILYTKLCLVISSTWLLY